MEILAQIPQYFEIFISLSFRCFSTRLNLVEKQRNQTNNHFDEINQNHFDEIRSEFHETILK